MNERLKAARKKLRLTQREFGSRIGVKDTAISKLENGENSITDQVVIAVCREYGICEEWLRTGNGGDEAMFERYDDKTIAALAAEYHLNDLDEYIVKAYVKMPEARRAGIREYLRNLSRLVLDKAIAAADTHVSNEILHAHIDPDIIDGLMDRTSAIFKAAFPPADDTEAVIRAAQPKSRSKLADMRAEYAEDFPPAAPPLTLEQEADAFAALAAEQARAHFLLEKKQALSPLSANESGAALADTPVKTG